MKIIKLRDYGIMPKTDITLKLKELFLENGQDTEFVFEDDEYYLFPHEEMRYDYRISNSDPMPYRVLGIWLKDMKNCVLSGCGARLVFEGHMQPFTLDHCENITIDGFYIDWKYPLASEGEVVACDKNSLEVYIDSKKFPHRIVDDMFEFYVGAGEWYRATANAIAFEPENYTVRKNTGDIYYNSVSKIKEDVYRLELRASKDLKACDMINVRHNVRIHAGAFFEKCRDIVMSNVTFYSCGGLGCLAQFCHNLTFDGVNFLPNREKGRYISSGRDDGMHITCNSGKVIIKNSKFHALMDDPINVHGCCVILSEVIDNKTVLCKYGHRQACGFHYWADDGDEIAFIKRDDMSGVLKLKAASYQLQDLYTFKLEFKDEIPQSLLDAIKSGEEYALDNLTNTVSFECKNNHFSSCRARGLLVSTPKTVVITDNFFQSSGSAILVAGDSNGWFESGECNDLEITGNTFAKECMTSMYQFCNGVISIYPIVPKPDVFKPYHKNIKIHNNKFVVEDARVLYAISCKNLEFCDNEIVRNCTQDIDEDALLEYCVNFNVKNAINVNGETKDLKITTNNCK